MNRKEILNKGFQKTKQFFWIYVAAAATVTVISGIGGGVLETVGDLSKLLYGMRSGLLSYESIMDKGSAFWSLMLSENGILQGLGILPLVVTIFVSNPLAIGMSKLFLNGKPRYEMLWQVFGKNYGQIVKTSFAYNFLMTIISYAATVVYMIAVFVGITATAVAAYQSEVSVVAALGGGLYVLVLTVLYMVVMINISYDFSQISYILAEEPLCGFTEAYARSRAAVKGKKKKIFSVDFVFMLLSAVAVIVPTALICMGVCMEIMKLGGAVLVAAGLLSIIPAMFFGIFVSVMRNAAWAEIYLSLKQKPEETTVGVYQCPENETEISYTKEKTDEE